MNIFGLYFLNTSLKYIFKLNLYFSKDLTCFLSPPPHPPYTFLKPLEFGFCPIIIIINNELHVTKLNWYFSVLGLHYLSLKAFHSWSSYSLPWIFWLSTFLWSSTFLTTPSYVFIEGLMSSMWPFNTGVPSVLVLDTLFISLLTSFLGNFTYTQ